MLNGKQVGSIPFWFMRQAGRYLPEYREMRAKQKDFLSFCYTPEAAAEVTLQPIRRFGMSAAIIFSDILVIPHALGMHVWFEEGKGPQITPIDANGFKGLSLEAIDEKLAPVYEALKLTKAALPADTALIGFAGSPWTLACYAVEGKGSRDFSTVRMKAFREPEFFRNLIGLFEKAVARHCINQIGAGAEIIQLFDSWSGVLSEVEFVDYVIKPTTRIVSEIRKIYPHIPIIGFPRLSGSKTLDYVTETKVSALSFDGSVTLAFAHETLAPKVVLQGNLDSILLAENKQQMLNQAKRIIDTMRDKAFVFNLGHGILPHTPIPHVEALCELIRQS